MTSPPQAAAGLVAGLPAICRDIKLSHSIFALPFAVLGLLLGTGGKLPDLRLGALVLAAMLLARSGAMAWNRWADREFDAGNPRTAGRALPAGRVTPRSMLTFALLCAAGFLAVAAALHPLCLALAPLVLVVLYGYSFAKRFSALAHLALGLALALAPPAAYVAARGAVDAAIVPALWLAAGVLGWVAGFDIIYACQDVEHDRRSGLHSVPARLGVPAALQLARGLHLLMLGCLAAALLSAGLATLSWVAFGLVAALLVVEHALVAGGNLSRVNAAFFTMNGLVSVVFAVLVGTELVRR